MKLLISLLKNNFINHILVWRDDPHLVLDNAFSKIKLNGIYPHLEKSPYAKITFNSRWGNTIWFLFSNFFIAVNTCSYLIKNRNQNTYVVIREFSNWVVVMSIPLFFFFRRKVFFNINHNVKAINKHFPIALKFLCLCGFRFILFDGEDIRPFITGSFSKNFFFPFFPINEKPELSERRLKIEDKKIVVGFVGDFRNEKINEESIKVLLNKLNKSNEFSLKIGLRDPSSFMTNFADQIQITSTRSRKDYLGFLDRLDVVVIFAAESAYYSRHSGTVMDALKHRVVPIVPDFPVFRRQVSSPKRVGLFYSDFNDLLQLMDSDFSKRLKTKKLNLDSYLDARSKVQDIRVES